MRASTSALELSWTSIPNAQYYLLEVQKLPVTAIGGNEKAPTAALAALKEEQEDQKPIAPMRAVTSVSSAPKFIYQSVPGTAAASGGDKKPMIILQQPKKQFQIATGPSTVRGQSVFKVMPSGGVSTSQSIKVVQKPMVSAAGTIQMQRPTFTGNVIKLMPGTILSGNKIIMKPATTQSQQIIVGGSVRPNIMGQTLRPVMASSSGGQQIKFNTVSTAQRIVMPAGNIMQQKPITIGGRTVTLQLAGQKKVTLVGNAGGVRTSTPQKIIMMPSGSIVQTTSTTTITSANQSQAQPRIEQLDGAIDDLDGQDIESQISTVKIEKQTEDGGEGVRVTTSGNSEKLEENEAAAILSTISEQSHLSSHSVNTVIPLHDEK